MHTEFSCKLEVDPLKDLEDEGITAKCIMEKQVMIMCTVLTGWDYVR
jgi:hypothetical protein